MQRFLLYSVLTLLKLKVTPDAVTLLVFIVPETLERVKSLATTIVPSVIVETLPVSIFTTLVFSIPILCVADTPTGSTILFKSIVIVPIDKVEETPVTLLSTELPTLPIEEVNFFYR